MFTSQEPAHRLRCAWCGTARQLTADEFFEVNRTEWPRCCQCPMVLEAGGQSVGPDDVTDVEWTGRSMQWTVPGSSWSG